MERYPKDKGRRQAPRSKQFPELPTRTLLEGAALLALVIGLVFLVRGVKRAAGGEGAVTAGAVSGEFVADTAEGEQPDQAPTPEPEPTALPEFVPEHRTDPEITRTKYMVDGEETDHYKADESHIIDFSGPDDYTQMEGIVTFRGNNFRNTSSYGTAALDTAGFGDYWTVETGAMGGWGGSGWTGQPLAVKWPQETKQIMNMKDWAKQKQDLVEVIYATLAGRVYFIDLETGQQTRDSLYLGYPFKGAGSLDPRGYPLMYLGGGVAGDGTPRILVVSLIDGEVLFETGNSDRFAPRGWSAWDSAPLLDAETDQLIYPGENGVLYLIDLNTYYDPAAGTIEVRPDVVKFAYYTKTGENSEESVEAQ